MRKIQSSISMMFLFVAVLLAGIVIPAQARSDISFDKQDTISVQASSADISDTIVSAVETPITMVFDRKLPATERFEIINAEERSDYYFLSVAEKDRIPIKTETRINPLTNSARASPGL